jgi:hypothetical protein
MHEPQNAIPFPCYAVMSNNCKGGVVLPRDDGSAAMALFTTEEKVRKFRAAHASQMFAGPSVKFDWDHELLLYLEALPPQVTHIGVDPEKLGSMVIFIPVVEMKQAIKNRMADED